MAYLTGGIIGGYLGVTTSDAKFALGTRSEGDNGSTWVYVQASGAIDQYDYVTIDESFQATAGAKTAVDAGHRIGFAQVAFADNEYGWVALNGASGLKVNAKGACAADIKLYTSAVAGTLDDALTSQSLINGVVLTTAVATATGARGILATYVFADAP